MECVNRVPALRIAFHLTSIHQSYPLFRLERAGERSRRNNGHRILVRRQDCQPIVAPTVGITQKCNPSWTGSREEQVCSEDTQRIIFAIPGTYSMATPMACGFRAISGLAFPFSGNSRRDFGGLARRLQYPPHTRRTIVIAV